jgi:hypothetical protein
VLTGGDPVAAARELIEARSRCFAALSVLCLDGVDQPDSAAMENDRRAVRAAQQEGNPPRGASWRAAGASLVQRLGDSALVALEVRDGDGRSAPDASLSLLLIRTDAGWRIRDLLAGG